MKNVIRPFIGTNEIYITKTSALSWYKSKKPKIDLERFNIILEGAKIKDNIRLHNIYICGNLSATEWESISKYHGLGLLESRNSGYIESDKRYRTGEEYAKLTI